ncbi:MAG TPA: DUF2092 domain-containing protein [bacterium]
MRLAVSGLFVCLAAGLLPGVQPLRAADAPRAAPPAAPPETSPTTPQAGFDPVAYRLLRSALDRLSSAKAFSFVAEVTSDTTLPSGQRVQFTGRIETELRRPDRLRVSYDGEQRSTRSWYDGKSFTLLDVGTNVYACYPSAASLEDFLGGMRDKLGFTPPLALLLREDPAKRAFARIRRGFAVGSATMGGTTVEHLAFSGDKSDWQFWIEGGLQPTIKRIVVSFREQPATPEFSATFLSWDFSPNLGDDLFTFAPPAGATQCDFRLMPETGGTP